jgi:hypothetical protein
VQVASITSSVSVGTGGSKAVSSGTFEESSLSSFYVVSSPSFEDGGLESTSVGESDSPGECTLLVDSVKVKASILLRLATGEEHDSGNSGDVSASEYTSGRFSDLLTARFRTGVVSSGSDHVGLDDSSLNNKSVSLHLRHNTSKELFRDSLAFLKSVVAIKADLRLDDGYKAVILGDSGIDSKSHSLMVKSELSRSMSISIDVNNTSPLAETDTTSVVTLASFGKSIKTKSGSLEIFSSLVSTDGSETLINVHTDNNVTLIEDVLEALTFGSVLVESGLEHDNATDVLLDFRGSEQKFSVGTDVFSRGLNSDSIELGDHSGGSFISSQDSLTGGSECACGLDKLSFEVFSSDLLGHGLDGVLSLY